MKKNAKIGRRAALSCWARLRRMTRHSIPILGLLASLSVISIEGALGQVRQRTFVLEEDFRLDGHEHILAPIGHFLVSRDGAFVVGQAQDNQFKVFSGDGELLATLGGEGQGPGEFERLSNAGWVSDTLWVYDARNRRFTLFGPSWTLVRTVPRVRVAVPQAGQEDQVPEFAGINPRALYADGGIHATLFSPTGPGADALGTVAVAATLDSIGTIRAIVARYPDWAEHPAYGYYYTFADGSRRGRPFPLVTRPEFTVSSDGSHSFLVEGYEDEAQQPQLRVTSLSPAGDTLYRVDLPMPADPLPGSVADSVLNAVTTSLREPSFANWTSAQLARAADAWEDRARAALPHHFPPTDLGRSLAGHGIDVVVSDSGGLWIPLRATGSSRQYLILDSNGQRVGQVELPANVVLVAVSGAQVWGLQHDEYDVQSVVRFRMRVQEASRSLQ